MSWWNSPVEEPPAISKDQVEVLLASQHTCKMNFVCMNIWLKIIVKILIKWLLKSSEIIWITGKVDGKKWSQVDQVEVSLATSRYWNYVCTKKNTLMCKLFLLCVICPKRTWLWPNALYYMNDCKKIIFCWCFCIMFFSDQIK